MEYSFWLVDPSLGAQIEQASKLLAGAAPKEIAELRDRMNAEAEESRLVSRSGSTATIRIRGALMPGASLAAYILGLSTTRYGDILAALAECREDDSVKQVVFDIDSGGGTVDGFIEVVDAIRACPKPMSVKSVYACSAAYGIAAATGGKIEATSRDAEFGSIGVAITFIVLDEEVDITSTEAPKKRPNVSTEEGQAVVRERLDGYHALFVEAIAEGRGRTVDEVNEGFGRGAVMLASAAKAAGLIDKVPSRGARVAGTAAQAERRLAACAADTQSTPTGAEPARGESDDPTPPSAAGKTRKVMNEEELKAQHRALYDSIVEAAEKRGAEAAVAEERDRIGAHLALGEKSGDMKTALDAVKAGTAMTQTLMATYMAAGMNRSDREAHAGDSAAAEGALEGADTATESEAEDEGDQAWASYQRRKNGEG